MRKLKSQVVWYESQLIWGPLPLGAGIVLTVVASMKHDLRWLLWFAAPCFIVASWAVLGNWLRTWRLSVALVIVATFVCGTIYQINMWLGHSDVTDKTTTASIQTTSPPSVANGNGNSAPTNVERSLPSPVAAKKSSHPISSKAPSSLSSSPPMSQDCAPGASCAMSNGQQGGITAGTINNYDSPERHLPTEQCDVIQRELRQKNLTVMVGTMMDVPDGYDYALEILNCLKPVVHLDPERVMHMGTTGAMFTGVEVSFYGDTKPPGMIVEVDLNSPPGIMFTALNKAQIAPLSGNTSPDIHESAIRVIVGKQPKHR